MVYVTDKSTKKTTSIEQELRASEERYQAFIRNSNEGIWRFELDKPIAVKLPVSKQIELMFKHAYLAEANEALAAMYGVKSVRDLLGTRLSEFLLPDDPKNIAYLTAFVKSKYSLSGAESHEVDSHGNQKIFRNSLVGFVENDKLVRAWGTQTDITEQHLTLAALRASEERLALALSVSKMGIWEWNVVTDSLLWSAELKALFGLPPDEEITYERYLSLFHPDDRPKMQQTISQAMETGQSYMVEHRVVWPDGSTHWLLCQGQAFIQDDKVVRMVGTCMNIDKRKKFEVELHESEERFRNMADAAPVLIWVSGPNCMLTYFNKPWRDFTGRKPGEDLGDGWQEVIHPDDLNYCVLVYKTAFDNREPYRMEYRVRRYDGKYLWMLDKGAPRYSKEGEFLGFVGSMIEVEEIKSTKKRQQELEEVNRKLKQQSEQLIELSNSKDEFISVASHQLRTPATGVKQYIGMLLEGYGGELNDDQVKMLQTAYESNERQLRIIDDLLKIAHLDAGQVTLVKDRVDLVHLIEAVIDEQANKFKHRQQRVTFHHKYKQVMALIDSERMRMVLENLIDNASKYTPDGKDITITLISTPKNVTISVTDQGVGVAKKDIPRLFRKFSRVDNALSTLVGGTGLGLYWVKKIVMLHNGTISVESKPRKGSTFTFTIPRTQNK